MANSQTIHEYINHLQQAIAAGNDTLADNILDCLRSLHYISWQVIEILVDATISKFYHQLPDIYLAKLIKIVRQRITDNTHLLKLTAKDDSRKLIHGRVEGTIDKINKILLTNDDHQSSTPPLLLYAELQLLQLQLNRYEHDKQSVGNNIVKTLHHLDSDCRTVLSTKDANCFDKMCKSLWDNPMKLDNLMFYVIIDNFAHIIKSIDNEEFKLLVYTGKDSKSDHITFGLKSYIDLVVKGSVDQQHLLLPLCKLIYELLTLMTHIKPYQKEVIEYITKLQALAGAKAINDMVKALLDKSYIGSNHSLSYTTTNGAINDYTNNDNSLLLRLQHISNNVIQVFPSPPALLIDRPQLITALSKNLLSRGRCAIIPRDVAIPYGIGKSTLAIQYAIKYKREYNIIYWLQADSELSLQRDMIELAKRIVYSHAFKDKAITKLRNLLKSDYKCIEFIEDFRKCCMSNMKCNEVYESIISCLIKDILEKDICGSWLLIYNRVNDVDIIENYIPKLSTQGQAIIISCQRNWKSNVQVSLFSTDQAVDYLQSTTQQMATYSCNKIAENLLNMPIALALTASYVQAKKTTMMDYTNFICTSLTKTWNPVNGVKKLLLTKAKKRYETVKYVVLTAWKLNVDEVIQEVPQASKIIAVLGYLPSENIPLQILRDYYKSYIVSDHTIQWNAITNLLQHYNLVNKIKDNYWSIHPWFQLFAREKAHKEGLSEIILQQLLQLFYDKLSFCDDNYEQNKEMKSFVKYTMACLKYSHQYDTLINLRINLVIRICRLFYEFKEYRNAKLVIHQANASKLLEIRRLNIVSHPVISKRCLIGYCKLCRIASKIDFMLGNMKDAVNVVNSALGMINNSNDDEDIDIRTIQAYLYFDIGVINTLLKNYDIAEKNFLKAMNTDDFCVNNSLRLADIMYQLGIVYGLNNKLDKSVSYLTSCLHRDKQEYGLTHCHVAMDHLELGRSMTLQGNVQQAMNHYEQTLQIISKEWKTTSNCILTLITVYIEYGRNYYLLRDYSKSLINLKEALQLTIDYFGERSLYVASIYYHLGKVYRQMKDLQQSLVVLELTLEIQSHELDYYSITIAETYDQIGLTMSELGMVDRALSCYRKSLDIAKNTLDDNDLLTSDYCLKIGQLLVLQEDYKEAINILEQSLHIRQNQVNDSDPQVTAIYYELAIAFKGQNQYVESMNYLDKSIKYVDILNSDDFDFAKCYTAIASIKSIQYHYDDALLYYQKAVQIYIDKYGRDSQNLYSIYDNIGDSYLYLNDYCNAMDNYKLSLEIKLKLLAEDNLQVAQSYYNCWTTARKQLKHHQAKHYIDNCLNIRLKSLQSNHPLLASTYLDIGLTMRDLKCYKDALVYFKNALDIFIKCVNDNNLQVATCYHEIGVTWFERGYNKRALEHLELANKIWQNNFIDSSFCNYVSTTKLIGQVYLNMAKKAMFNRQYYLVTMKIELCEKQLHTVLKMLKKNPDQQAQYGNDTEDLLRQCQILKRNIWIQFIRDLILLIILVYGIKVILFFRRDYNAS